MPALQLSSKRLTAHECAHPHAHAYTHKRQMRRPSARLCPCPYPAPFPTLTATAVVASLSNCSVSSYWGMTPPKCGELRTPASKASKLPMWSRTWVQLEVGGCGFDGYACVRHARTAHQSSQGWHISRVARDGTSVEQPGMAHYQSSQEWHIRAARDGTSVE